VLVLVFLLIAFGIFLIFKGYQIKQRIKRFKQYVSLISTKNMTSLENIAASTSQSLDFVKKDLQKMIDKKFFANAAIDVAANEVVIGGKTTSAATSVSAPQQTQTAAQSKLEKFTCSGCGASGTKPKGALSNCDYCGSTVK
jgi:predicted PurR-regulated permease PerM